MEGGRVLVLGGSGNWSPTSRGEGEKQRFKDSRGKQDGDHSALVWLVFLACLDCNW